MESPCTPASVVAVRQKPCCRPSPIHNKHWSASDRSIAVLRHFLSPLLIHKPPSPPTPQPPPSSPRPDAPRPSLPDVCRCQWPERGKVSSELAGSFFSSTSSRKLGKQVSTFAGSLFHRCLLRLNLWTQPRFFCCINSASSPPPWYNHTGWLGAKRQVAYSASSPPWYNRTGWLGVKHQVTYSANSPPWYNRTGWLGVKHQVTYSASWPPCHLIICTTQAVSLFALPIAITSPCRYIFLPSFFPAFLPSAMLLPQSTWHDH